MVNVADFEITRVEQWERDTYLRARYPEWCYEYAFIIKGDEEVCGQTSTGHWVPLSRNTGMLIRRKLEAFRREPQARFA